MATLNPFDLLGDDDAEDPSQLIAAQKAKARAEPKKSVAPAAQQAKLPSKPLPPTQAVKEAKSESARGGRGGGRGYARGRGAGGASYRDSSNSASSYGNKEFAAGQRSSNEADRSDGQGSYRGPRGPFRGGRRGGFSNGEMGEGDNVYSRRPFERHSGTGRGNDIKREGAGRGNWGTQTDELAQVAEDVVTEDDKTYADKPSGEGDATADGDKEAATNKDKQKEAEDKEMTLEEYEKVLEEKRKALLALKVSEQRKVDVKEFESMQQLANKKANDDIFVKLGADKDRKKELAEKEERAKKSVSINEFLKPAEGERHYGGGGGRGRGRGRGSRGGYSAGSETSNNVKAPSIEDPGQFPTLGGK